MIISIIFGTIPVAVIGTIAATGALVVGGFISYFIWDKALKTKSKKIIKEAESEAEVIRKDKILQAKEKFLQLKSEHEKDINERSFKLVGDENRFKQKEISFSQKFEENQRKSKEIEIIRDNLQVQMDLVEKRGEELDKMHKQQVEQLEAISGLSAEQSKEQLIESLKA